jgi:RNA polymerase sigma-54 factor
MAFEVKLGQDLRLRQQLVMTPQLQQAIKILQLSLPDLETVIQTELERNPMLEPLDSSPSEITATAMSDAETYADSEPAAPANGELVAEEAPVTKAVAPVDPWEPPPGEIPTTPVASEPHDAAVEIKEQNGLDKIDWREYVENYSNNWQEGSFGGQGEEDRPSLESTLTRKNSLEDHLIWQLRMSSLTNGDQKIGAAIIYNLNDDGYLETPIEDLAALLEIDPAEVARILSHVQRFDPPGVGARDLRECLAIQLRNLGMEESLAARIVANHMDLLEKHRYAEIAKALGVPLEMAGQAIKVISLLEPKPGRDYSGQEPIYIVPDVFIQKVGDNFLVTLNEEAVPRLRLASYYQRVLNDSAVNNETRDYLQERLRSARWLVKSIYQRQQTIFKVANSIVKFQREFFEHGVSRLKPLVLRDVADDIGMHESTISRATANKYAHTPQGIFELKFFFTSGVRANDGGGDVSAETVKEKIRSMVASERREGPLSDQAIAEILRAQNINIARRTVAKYREALGILPSARRKQIAINAKLQQNGSH